MQPGFAFDDTPPPPDSPLAARMRPRTLDEFVGQEVAAGSGSMLRTAVESGRLPSIILWGPPGCGKTTLARLLARRIAATFIAISAVSSGVAELRKLIAEARARREQGQRTVVFIDEIHRFNKAQQDVILPHVEDGTMTLIGATTENPSFEVVAPLLSRVRVIRLHTLTDPDLERIIAAALADGERGLGEAGVILGEDSRNLLVQGANGDARAALTALEIAAGSAAARGSQEISPDDIRGALQDRRPYFDKQADFHYDTISAFIKSMRGSDPDASLYWLARMVEAGEDPLFIVRRMVILAAEDIGLADPGALTVAVACQQAVHFVGMPEGFLPLAECCLYLALAPKSNSAYTAYKAAMDDAVQTSHLPVPLHLRRASTGLMRDFGYGQGYRYAHDEREHYAAGATYLPEQLIGRQYYRAGSLGSEGELAEGLAALRSSMPVLPATGDDRREADED
ncbi:MAG: replication-associated recombination protein A [Tepidiformaceae bacterium]